MYHYMVTGPQCVVLFDWEGEQVNELSIKDGDIVRLLRWVSADWLEGELGGKVGQFPAVFVDVTEDLPVTGPRCFALHDFEGLNDFELTFAEGDIVALLGYCSEEWFRGSIQGRQGVFPASFVETIEDLPVPKFEVICCCIPVVLCHPDKQNFSYYHFLGDGARI